MSIAEYQDLAERLLGPDNSVSLEDLFRFLQTDVVGDPLPPSNLGRFPLLPPDLANVGGLSDLDDQHLCARVCSLTSGMTAAFWAQLTLEQRLGWMREAVSRMIASGEADEPSTGRENSGAPMSASQLELLLGNESRRILEIADSQQSADAKMREICDIDRRLLGWNSVQWAQLLHVSAAAIRKTEFWTIERRRLIDRD